MRLLLRYSDSSTLLYSSLNPYSTGNEVVARLVKEYSPDNISVLILILLEMRLFPLLGCIFEPQIGWLNPYSTGNEVVA